MRARGKLTPMAMESLSIVLSSSPPLHNHYPKTPYKSHHTFKTISLHTNNHQFFNITTHSNQILPLQNSSPPSSSSHPQKIHHVKSLSSFIILNNLFFNCLPSLAASSETVVEQQQLSSDKINLEAILVSIDEFFNRYPFLVAGVTFIWLVVIPLTQNYMKKYKFISAIDAFRKLRDDPSSVLLDIRDGKSLAYLGSPNLKILNKSAVQVQFDEREDEQVFVKGVLEMFSDPGNTVVCVLDNFDGNSMKVAELLCKNGFKEAYAIRAGIRGKDGWQAIQENLLPPSVHIYPRKKGKASQQLEVNGASNQQSEDVDRSQGTDNGYVKKSIKSNPQAKLHSISLSPYPQYPDLKPPSSPTPAKPRT